MEKGPVGDRIQFVGVSALDPEEQNVVNTLSTEYFEKLKHAVKNTVALIVHVKRYEKEGTQQKYSLHIHLSCPSRDFETDKHHDFDLSRACHAAFRALLKEVHHSFHTDTSRPHR
ncbi:hypothetical protein GF342_03720 [Candidatus Woesearchaeota archaeon]|nr:hypothetical protein [Candidatus Woesearchaeota archaeon]